jgi:hypothetical protein
MEAVEIRKLKKAIDDVVACEIVELHEFVSW